MRLTNAKKMLTGLVIATSLTLVGCGGAGTKEGSTSSTASSWKEYIEDAPSFEPVDLGDAASNLIASSVAGFAKNKHDALVALDKAVDENNAGYKVFQTLENADDASKADMTAKLSDQDKADLAGYLAAAAKITAAEEANKAEYLKAALGAINFDKSKLGFKAALGVPRLIEQGSYIKDTVEWNSRYQATLENVKNDTSR